MSAADAVDAQAIAEAVRDSLWARDRASQALGMQIHAVTPTSATLTMTVRADMLNGHGSCHGGLITTLADSAFAFACNACNELTVATGISIDIVAPAHQGDLLTAHCVQQQRGGRTGLFDCEVHNQRGERIALFRGHSYTMKGRPVVEGLPMPAARVGAAGR
jgi:acyl-CoA thioesterase